MHACVGWWKQRGAQEKAWHRHVFATSSFVFGISIQNNIIYVILWCVFSYDRERESEREWAMYKWTNTIHNLCTWSHGAHWMSEREMPGQQQKNIHTQRRYVCVTVSLAHSYSAWLCAGCVWVCDVDECIIIGVPCVVSLNGVLYIFSPSILWYGSSDTMCQGRRLAIEWPAAVHTTPTTIIMYTFSDWLDDVVVSVVRCWLLFTTVIHTSIAMVMDASMPPVDGVLFARVTHAIQSIGDRATNNKCK